MSARRIEPSRTEERILRYLDFFGAQYPYGLASRSGNPFRTQFPKSTVKAVFQKLSALGYISIVEKTVEGRIRRYGDITDKGRAWLREIEKERK